MPGIDVSILPPPYELPPQPYVRSGPAPFGSIVLCRIPSRRAAVAELGALVLRLRSADVPAPVVALVEAGSSAAELDVMRRVGGLPVSGALAAEALTLDELRYQLTTPTDLTADVVRWWATLPNSPSAKGLTLLAEHLRSVDPLRPREGGPHHRLPRRLRERLRRQGLPGPKEWERLMRCLRICLAAQRQPAVTLTRLGLQYGFCDQAAASRSFRELFDLTASEARGILGWEWLGHRYRCRRWSGSR